MVFPVVGGDGKPTGYEIENSLRLTDNAYLNITRSSQSNTTGTFSAWIKTAAQNSFQLAGGHTDVNNRSYIYFPSSGDGFSGGIFSRTSGSADLNFSTSAVYRDPSAWYHLVVAIDTTQSTESNRVKWYVNGEQITSFSASTYPSQNASIPILNKATQTIGAGYGASAVSVWSDGYMAEVYYIDGTQYAASNFGETNDNGVWIPKDASGDLTFGTNGFYLEFKQTGTSQNSSGIGADTSGNDNHLAVNSLSATDVTTDTPTNNFATVNRLTETQGVIDFSEGNTEIAGNTTTQGSARSSIQIPPSGKWYIESEFDAIGGSGSSAFAFVPEDYTSHALNASGARGVAGSYSNAASSRVLQLINATSQIGSNINVSAGVIVQLAIDQDNGKAWVGKEDTYYNSSGGTDGNPSTGSNPTFTFTAENFDVFFGVYKGGGGDGIQRQKVNFGNPAFSISSGNADANGYGNFEYAVPSGFYSLCTKNLAEFG